MRLLQDIDLAEHTTFGIHATCRWWAEFDDANELQAILNDTRFAGVRKFVLGGGSNTLFTLTHFPGLVLHPANEAIEVIDENEEYRFVKVGAGKPWTPFVEHCCALGWAGLENLAYIPGSVGGAAVQNIGAYGLEVAERIVEVECFNPETETIEVLTNAECDYGYRSSVFKHEKAHLIVLSVTFALPKTFTPIVTYKAVAPLFEANPPKSPADVATVITQTRRKKLPEPGLIGSAGSFFKNPIVSRVKLTHLLEETPQLVSYPLAGGRAKLAAGWLIDAVGLKGKRLGNAAVYEKNALVLVNAGNATGQDVFALSNLVSEKVYRNFGVRLELEPVIVS